jgi:hypothetical protein
VAPTIATPEVFPSVASDARGNLVVLYGGGGGDDDDDDSRGVLLA